MKRAAIAVHGLRSGGIRRHGSKAIPLLISLAAPMLGACSLSPVETASTSTAPAPAAKDAVQARKRAVALANWPGHIKPGKVDQPLHVVMIGTDFQVRVWEALLKIPMGKARTYSSIAASIGAPSASRAVGAANGANPISFVVPCHRAIGKSGALTGYHWGLTRKRAILGWEAGQVTG